MNFDWCYALCLKKFYHRSHFTVGGSWNKSLRKEYKNPIYMTFCPYIVPYQNFPMPLISFLNFQNCAPEKLLKSIFSPINLTWENFQTHIMPLIYIYMTQITDILYIDSAIGIGNIYNSKYYITYCLVHLF